MYILWFEHRNTDTADGMMGVEGRGALEASGTHQRRRERDAEILILAIMR